MLLGLIFLQVAFFLKPILVILNKGGHKSNKIKRMLYETESEFISMNCNNALPVTSKLTNLKDLSLHIRFSGRIKIAQTNLGLPNL